MFTSVNARMVMPYTHPNRQPNRLLAWALDTIRRLLDL